MLDYHLHLWPHGSPPSQADVDDLASWCEAAASRSVREIAVTEHLFRFVQARQLLDGFWEDERSTTLRAGMAAYFAEHATADLDSYVASLQQARDAGLPVRIGLEVDYYPGRMDEVATMLEGYPFDVLLGSIHWLGAWRFDDVDDPMSIAEWRARDVDRVWEEYASAVVELAQSRTCDVLAHPDLIKVVGMIAASPEELWQRTASALASSQMAAEISSAGWRKPVGEQYAAGGFIDLLHDSGVPVTTASDAHRIEDIAYRFDDLACILEAAGYDTVCAFNQRSRQPEPLRAGIRGDHVHTDAPSAPASATPDTPAEPATRLRREVSE